ncbi:MAG: AAA family ATPase [Candidatus Omnitrophota bacterium]|jgi:general secretion pathway protein A
MSYYEALNLKSEPFSTSPDPYFFYPSSSHDSALKRLEIAIRLRRGLNVILGDVGTGKTTLSRMLIQLFKDEPDFVFHMILDPSYKTEFQFLSSLAKMFGVNPVFRSTLDYKDALEKYLFQKGVDEKKTIVLLIDEGQKLTPSQVEILRTLLNYETNEFKLLQLIILSQIELLPKIRRIRNFMDRINLKYIINPLDESETRALIRFRLKQAGHDDAGQELFTDNAIRHIYEYTQGYPRKISMFCHDALEMLIMRNKKFVDEGIVEEIMAREVR